MFIRKFVYIYLYSRIFITTNGINIQTTTAFVLQQSYTWVIHDKGNNSLQLTWTTASTGDKKSLLTYGF